MKWIDLPRFHSRRFFSRLASVGVLLLALGACATLDQPMALDYDESMAIARTHAEANQVGAAVTALQQAAALQPARKEPWLEIAQLRFRQDRHVDALAAAEQVLRRDPADQVAYGVTIASGLQVAQKTMERLRAAAEQPPSDDRREQARLIAALMAEVFGPELLLPADLRARLAKEAVDQYKASRADRLPESQKPRGDPLDLLGGD